MKLNSSDLAVVTLPHKGESQSLGQPSLSGARRTLENQVFLGPKALENLFEFSPGDETSIRKDVIDGVRFDGCGRDLRLGCSICFIILRIRVCRVRVGRGSTILAKRGGMRQLRAAVDGRRILTE